GGAAGRRMRPRAAAVYNRSRPRRSLPLSWRADWRADWRTTTARRFREPWRPRWRPFAPGRRPRRAALAPWPGRIRGPAADGTTRCPDGTRPYSSSSRRLIYLEYNTEYTSRLWSAPWRGRRSRSAGCFGPRCAG